MGIEGIDILKNSETGRATKRETEDWMMRNALSPGDRREREGNWKFPVPRAYIFVPDIGGETCTDAVSKFRKHVGNRSIGFYTAGDDWTYGLAPRPWDMICFYNDKGALKVRGRSLEDVVLELLTKKKLMLLLEAKDAYEVREVR